MYAINTQYILTRYKLVSPKRKFLCFPPIMSIFKHKLSPYSPKNYLRHVLYPYSVHFSKYDEKFSLKILNRRRRLSFISRSKGNQPCLRFRSRTNPPPTKTTKTTIPNSMTFGSHKSNSQFLSGFATL
jgi:hypothetical protein